MNPGKASFVASCGFSATLAAALSLVYAHAGQQKIKRPVLRVETRLVEVNVVVHDKKGNPVAGLNKDDFVLTDEHHPQKIQTFSVMTNAPSATPSQLALPPNTYTNRLRERAGVPTSVTAILLDGLNTRFQDQAYARDQVIRFLRQIQPADRIGLYTLGLNLHILHDFTTDASSIVEALKHYRGRASPELAASKPDQNAAGGLENLHGTMPAGQESLQGLEEFLQRAQERMASFYIANRVRATTAALETIANHLAGLPGRKSLIWVSGSFPFSIGMDQIRMGVSHEYQSFQEEVAQAARVLNNAEVAIYPVDARGLVTARSARADVGPGFFRPRRIFSMGPDPATFDTMNILAERTGGRAFYNTNDVMGAIRSAIDDSRVTYQLGYYPDPGQWDGKFHHIQVNVKRPGVKVRARKGYFAVAEPNLDAKRKENRIAQAAMSPLDATAVGLTVQVRAADVPGARSVVTRLQVEPRDIHFEQTGERWHASTDVGYVQLNMHGEIIQALEQTWDLNLRPDTYHRWLAGEMSVNKTVAVQPAASVLRIVVRDPFTGALGVVSVPLNRYFARN